jgi:hypothetical protein
MNAKDPILEARRASIADAVGCEVSNIKTVKELLECEPIGACEKHGRCWTHSEWQRCGSSIPCGGTANGLDGLCDDCRDSLEKR